MYASSRCTIRTVPRILMYCLNGHKTPLKCTRLLLSFFEIMYLVNAILYLVTQIVSDMKNINCNDDDDEEGIIGIDIDEEDYQQ